MTTAPNGQHQKKAEPNPALWPSGALRVEPLRLRRAPLLAAAIWFAAGEMLARQAWHPAVVLLVSVALLTALALATLRWHLRIAMVPLAALWMTVGLWCTQMEPAPPAQTALIHDADGLSRMVRGRVERVRVLPPLTAQQTQDTYSSTWHGDDAESDAKAAGAISVDLAVEAVEQVTPDVAWMAPTNGGVRITIEQRGDTLPALRCGDMVEAPMILRVPERYRDPGAWQYADYLLAQGIGVHATVRVAKVAVVHADAPKDEASLRCKLYAAQDWAAERLAEFVRSPANHRLPPVMQLSAPDAAMLSAMLFGDRTGLTRAQRLGFERTGSFHLFVVSGMHVALLAAVVFWLALRLRLSEWLTTPLTLILAAAYALLTGFGAPVQRALWMTAIFLVARLFSRERSVPNALGAAALGVLAWSPASLFEASFQMTFLAILAIGGIAAPLGERGFLRYARAARNLDDKWIDQALPAQLAQFRVMLRVGGRALAKAFGGWAYRLPSWTVRITLWAAELALVGAVTEMVMVLPMAMYFHRATMFALPANMVSVPLVAMVAPAAVATFAASLASPWMAMAPAAVTALLLHGIVAAIARVSSLHAADMRVPGPAWWIGIAAFAGWMACCWLVRRSTRSVWLATAILPLIAAMVLWPERPLVTPGVMEITAIDVGQGDSLLVISPEGRAMLIDAGGPVGSIKETAQASSAFDIGEEIVSPYLWSRRLRRLDVMALSHAHSDHMGGMAAVMRNFRPRELWVSVDPDSAAYRALLEEATSLGVVVRHLRAGDALEWGGVAVQVLAPEASYVNQGEPMNDDSLVLRLELGRASALLEGDAEAASESEMLTHGRVSPTTLLKVGHHGSRTSTTEAFLDAVQPTDAVISVGRRNTFGHPRPEIMARIATARTKLYRTDAFGLTTFLLGRDGSIRASSIDEAAGTSNP